MPQAQMIIDVREEVEYNEGHVNDAVNIPLGQVVAGSPSLSDVPKDTKLIVYCRSGARANSAIAALQMQGFSNLTNGINKETVETKYL